MERGANTQWGKKQHPSRDSNMGPALAKGGWVQEFFFDVFFAEPIFAKDMKPINYSDFAFSSGRQHLVPGLNYFRIQLGFVRYGAYTKPSKYRRTKGCKSHCMNIMQT